MTDRLTLAKLAWGLSRGTTRRVVGMLILVVLITEAILTTRIGSLENLEAEVEAYLLSHSAAP